MLAVMRRALFVPIFGQNARLLRLKSVSDSQVRLPRCRRVNVVLGDAYPIKVRVERPIRLEAADTFT